ncbi:MAG: hypothetical protein AAGE84_21940 [Cyanobacteria bacterium P01_G01_bin.39]
MAQPENNCDAIEESTKTHVLSEKERKVTVVAIVIFSLLILILLALIAEALINQHPVFEFLQYNIFKEKLIITGSISYNYDTTGQYLLSIEDVNGKTSFSYDNPFDPTLVSGVTNSDGSKLSHDYDHAERLQQIIYGEKVNICDV